MNRVLAIDYGEKRVGIAWSDLLGLTAQAQPFLANTPKLLSEIDQIIQDQHVSDIIVGLPIKMDGSDSLTTTKTREFADKLATHTGLPVQLKDERYSSKAVERQLIDMDMRRKTRKTKIDSAAAAFVLQGYLDSQSTTSSIDPSGL